MKLIDKVKSLFKKKKLRIKLDADDKVKLKIGNLWQLVAYLLDYHPVKTCSILLLIVSTLVLLQVNGFNFGKAFDMVTSIYR